MKTEPRAFFALGARGEDRQTVKVHLWAGGIEQLKAFGAVLRYDPNLLAFDKLAIAEDDWLTSGGRRAPLLRVLDDAWGELVLGNGITAGDVVSGSGGLAELHFRLLGEASEARFDLVAGFVDRGDGVGRRVVQLGQAQVLPRDYYLGENFPNPFNPSTSIRYALPKKGSARLTVYDVLGRKVRTLVDDDKHRAGYFTAVWDGHDDDFHAVASGMYFYLLEAGRLREARKMVLVK
ncbi:MAG: T9SS type A sorting domain-containing protein [Candidatus Latescibacterota bacterium]